MEMAIVGIWSLVSAEGLMSFIDGASELESSASSIGEGAGNGVGEWASETSDMAVSNSVAASAEASRVLDCGRGASLCAAEMRMSGFVGAGRDGSLEERAAPLEGEEEVV